MAGFPFLFESGLFFKFLQDYPKFRWLSGSGKVYPTSEGLPFSGNMHLISDVCLTLETCTNFRRLPYSGNMHLIPDICLTLETCTQFQTVCLTPETYSSNHPNLSTLYKPSGASHSPTAPAQSAAAPSRQTTLQIQPSLPSASYPDSDILQSHQRATP